MYLRRKSDLTNEYISPNEDYIQENDFDKYVIPDKLNVGLSDESILSTAPETIYCVDADGNQSTLTWREFGVSIDFNKAANKNVSGTVVFENVDFKQYSDKFDLMNCGAYEGEYLMLKFVNCRFGFFNNSYQEKTMNIVLKNCQFTRINSADSDFEGRIEIYDCLITRGDDEAFASDGLNLGHYDCIIDGLYVKDLDKPAESQGSAHQDGIQCVKNARLQFSRIRVEFPSLNYEYHIGTINVPFYMEASAEGTKADHCIFNGGQWYCIATCKDTIFNKVHMGHSWNKDSGLGNGTKNCTQTDLEENSFAYISSVWQESDGIHFLASNDTTSDQTIVIYTNKGKQEITLPYVSEKTVTSFDELTIDKEYIIEDANYMVAFNNDRQIRFVNYTNNPIPKSILE